MILLSFFFNFKGLENIFGIKLKDMRYLSYLFCICKKLRAQKRSSTSMYPFSTSAATYKISFFSSKLEEDSSSELWNLIFFLKKIGS